MPKHVGRDVSDICKYRIWEIHVVIVLRAMDCGTHRPLPKPLFGEITGCKPDPLPIYPYSLAKSRGLGSLCEHRSVPLIFHILRYVLA